MKEIINELIDKGMLVFNPFNLDLSEPRFVLLMEREKEIILEDNPIALIVANSIIDAEAMLLEYSIEDKYRDNMYVDIYAVDTLVRVSWMMGFKTMKEVRKFVQDKEEYFQYAFDNHKSTLINL
tara:strand:- start:31 stop:402 length:372 start_codon:yes stop_codon:yes gene_type:complete